MKRQLHRLFLFLAASALAIAQTPTATFPELTNRGTPQDDDFVVGYRSSDVNSATSDSRFQLSNLWANYLKAKADLLYQPKNTGLTALASFGSGIPYMNSSTGNWGTVTFGSNMTFNAATGVLNSSGSSSSSSSTAAKPYNIFFNGSSSTASTPGYPPKVAEYADWDALGITWNKYGVPSAYIWTLNNGAAANVDTFVDTNKTNLLVVQAFNNDLADGTSPATLITQLNTYLAARKAAGWDKILIIIPAYPKVFADHRYDTNIVTFINLLLADVGYVNGSKSDGFIRIDAEMLLKWSNNTTYYNANDQHMNTTGYGLFGATVAAEIRAWMAGARGTATLTITSPSSGQSVASDFTASISGYRHWQMLEWWASVPSAVGNGTDEAMYRVAIAPNAPPNVVTIKAADVPSAATKLYVRGRDTLGKLYVSSPVTLSPVTAAPVITSQPVSITPTIGTSASFSVTATGATSYQWYKNTVSISGATSSTYTIGSVSSGDDGTYYVIVTNSTGSTQSNNATLASTSSLTAPTFTTHPTTQTVITGASFTLTVAATGSPTITYQWKKNGTNISGATSTSYTVATASSGDAGSYTCVATNGQGSATSNAAVITVSTATTLIEDTFATGDMLVSPPRVPDTTGTMTWTALASYTNGGGYIPMANQYAKIDAGTANVTVTVEQYTVSGNTPQAGIAMRFGGTSNRLRFFINPTSWAVVKNVGSTSNTTVETGSGTFAVNVWHTLKVTAVGDVFYFYVDGVQVNNSGGTTVTDVPASNLVGVSQNGSGTVRYRNFKVTTP